MVGKGESHTCGPHSMGRLLAHIHKYTRRYMSEHLEQYGIGGSTYGFLFFLYHKEGLTEKEITDHMLVDKATTTRALSKLVQEGYVKKERDPDDKRVYRIFLTQKAERLRPKLRQLRRDWIEVVMGDLNESERTMLLELLTRIEENLQRSHGEEDRS